MRIQAHGAANTRTLSLPERVVEAWSARIWQGHMPALTHALHRLLAAARADCAEVKRREKGPS